MYLSLHATTLNGIIHVYARHDLMIIVQQLSIRNGKTNGHTTDKMHKPIDGRFWKIQMENNTLVPDANVISIHFIIGTVTWLYQNYA